MKPASRVFLIVCAAVLLIGLVLCLIGAAVGGEGIFSQTVDAEGDSHLFYPSGSSDWKRISVDISSADVTVRSVEGRSYVECVNFNELFCSVSEENGVLSIRTGLDPLRLLDSGSIASFGGVRNFFRFGLSGRKKEIIIGIGIDSPVSRIELSVEKGNVVLSALPTACDCSLNLKEGNLTAARSESAELLYFEIGRGDVRFDASSAKKIVGRIGSGEAIITRSGDVFCKIGVKEGEIRKDGLPVGKEYSSGNEENGSVTLSVEKGDVALEKE